jgi:UrcA family protein
MKNHNFRRLSLLATLLAAGVTNAHAEPGVVVNTRDLDLRKPEDVAALYTRIERRASDVCQQAASPWDAGRVAFIRKCAAAAIDDAVVRANVSALTALHESKREAARVAQNRGE